VTANGQVLEISFCRIYYSIFLKRTKIEKKNHKWRWVGGMEGGRKASLLVIDFFSILALFN
jgi:hypothetical protein